MIRVIHSVLPRLATIALVLAALLPLAGAAQGGAAAVPDSASLAPAASQAGASPATAQDLDFGKLPLYFVENRGQTDPRVAYYVLGGGTQVYLSADGVTFALTEPDAGASLGRDGRGEAFPEEPVATARVAPGGGPGAANDLTRNASPPRDATAGPRQRWAVKLDFIGANPHARPVGENQTQAVVSYFKGAPDQWHAGLPTYARVVYRDL